MKKNLINLFVLLLFSITNSYSQAYTQTTKNMKHLVFYFLFIGLLSHSRAQEYQSPKLLFDEDFTDGVFDDTNAGTNGGNWRLSGFAKFDNVNNREYPKAVLRYTKDGSNKGWDALLRWKNYDKPVYFDKEDDIVICKFKAFSDVAGNKITPDFGVEVAMLEDKPGAPYGHDMSFEVCQVWLRDGSPEGPLQLDANVENTASPKLPGTTQSHHNVVNGKETATTLGKTYLSEVIWRNRYKQGKSNIEVFGALNYSDFDVNQEMNSDVAPINPDYLTFNNVQIALFDKSSATATNYVYRTGYSNANAQIGIAYCHLGISKISDFNQDYIVDKKDSDTLEKYIKRSITTYTVKHGDATNDGKVNLADANPLIGFWSAKEPGPVSVKGTYNPTTGEVKVNLQNVSYLAISGPVGSMNQSLNLTGMDIKASGTIDNTMLGAYTDTKWNLTGKSLGLAVKPGINASDLKLTFNYKGSGLRNGISINFDQEFITGSEITSNAESTLIMLDDNTIILPAVKEMVKITIFNSSGIEVYSFTGDGTQVPSTISTKVKGFKILEMKNLTGDKIYLIKKYLSF